MGFFWGGEAVNGAVGAVGEKPLNPWPVAVWKGEEVAVEIEIEPFDTAIRHGGAGLSKEAAPQDPPKADAKRESKALRRPPARGWTCRHRGIR